MLGPHAEGSNRGVLTFCRDGGWRSNPAASAKEKLSGVRRRRFDACLSLVRSRHVPDVCTQYPWHLVQSRAHRDSQATTGKTGLAVPDLNIRCCLRSRPRVTRHEEGGFWSTRRGVLQQPPSRPIASGNLHILAEARFGGAGLSINWSPRWGSQASARMDQQWSDADPNPPPFPRCRMPPGGWAGPGPRR